MNTLNDQTDVPSESQRQSLTALTQDLIGYAETLVVDDWLPDSPVATYIQKLFACFRFLARGWRSFGKRIDRLAIYSIVFVALVLLIVKVFSLQHSAAAESWLILALGAAILLSAFGVPSQYSLDHVRESDVRKLRERLLGYELASEDELALLGDGVEAAEARVTRSVASLRWVIGVIWAAFYLVLSQYLSLTYRVGSTTDVTISVNKALELLIYTAIGAGSFWLATALYRRGIEGLFRTIDFALLERKRDFVLAEAHRSALELRDV